MLLLHSISCSSIYILQSTLRKLRKGDLKCRPSPGRKNGSRPAVLTHQEMANIRLENMSEVESKHAITEGVGTVVQHKVDEREYKPCC